MRYSIHNIVNIESNVQALSNYLSDYFLSSSSTSSEPDLIIRIERDVDSTKEGLDRIDRWFYGKEGEDFIFYDDFILGMKDKVLIKNIDSTPTEIYATKSVLRIDPRSRGSLSDIINIIVDLKLLKKGYLTIHAAGLTKGGFAILLAAFPNVGKTLCTLYLLKNGFKYLFDDTGFIDGKGTAYCNPFISTIGYHDFVKFIKPRDVGHLKYLKIALKGFPLSKSKIIGRIFEPPKIDLLKIEGHELAEKSRVDSVCILEIGERKVKEMDKEELAKKILIANEYSLPRAIRNPFMLAYSYFNDFDFEEMRRKELGILLKFLDGCKCYGLACKERDWLSVIKEVIR